MIAKKNNSINLYLCRIGTLDSVSGDPVYQLKISGSQGSSWQEAEINLGERGLFRPVFMASTGAGSQDYSSIAIDDISFLTCPGLCLSLRNTPVRPVFKF